jgi:hypothetical protein
VLAHPDGKKPFVDAAGNPIGLARRFLDQGYEVVIAAEAGAAANPNQTSILFTTYNRTRLQERVRYLTAICRSVAPAPGGHKVLCGCGHAGLWALLAAPAADAVVADCCQLDVFDDQVLLDPDLFCPGIRNIATFAGAAMLAAPHPLLMHNVAAGSTLYGLRSSYRILRAEKNLSVETRPFNDESIVASVLALVK